MQVEFFIGFCAFLGSILGAKHMVKKANELLTDDEKVKLVDFSSSNEKQYIAVPIIALAAFIIALEFDLFPLKNSIFLFAAFIFIVLGYGIYQTKKRFENAAFPQEYTNKIIGATVLRYTGVVVFMVLLNL